MVIGKAPHLVAAGWGAGFDDVGVQGALHKERGPHTRFRLHLGFVLLEHLDELRADALAFLFGVSDAFQFREQALAVVHARHGKM